jgi:hypothetical protein
VVEARVVAVQEEEVRVRVVAGRETVDQGMEMVEEEQVVVGRAGEGREGVKVVEEMGVVEMGVEEMAVEGMVAVGMAEVKEGKEEEGWVVAEPLEKVAWVAGCKASSTHKAVILLLKSI